MRISDWSSDVYSSDLIVNEGSGTTIVQTNPDHLFIENRANALIDSISFLPAPASAAPVPFDTVVINAGTIEGDLTFVNGGIYVNDGGTVKLGRASCRERVCK